MLNKAQKRETVKYLSKEIVDSKTVVFCDYKGLTVAQLREIRLALRGKKAKMKVVKKTLANLAVKESGIELDVRKLGGQVAIVYGGEDEVSAPKTIANFSKKYKKLKILAGLLEKKVLSIEEVKNLSSLPSKEEMLARVVGTINAPISGFVNVLAGNLRGVIQIIKAISEKKGSF